MEKVEEISLISFKNYTIYSRDVIIFATVFLFIRWCLLSRQSFIATKPSAPSLPFPPGLPFFGNMFSFRNDMRGILRKWTNEIGGLYRLRIGPMMNMVVISDIDVIQEAFVDQADAFSDRTIPPLIDVAMGKKGNSSSGSSYTV